MGDSSFLSHQCREYFSVFCLKCKALSDTTNTVYPHKKHEYLNDDVVLNNDLSKKWNEPQSTSVILLPRASTP